MRAAVVGGGSWGSAFALHLGRLGIPTSLWIREPEVFEETVQARENRAFLPGFRFPDGVSFVPDLAAAVSAAETVFIAVPSKFCRSIYQKLAGLVSPGQTLVSLTKGLEERTLLRMSRVIEECFSSRFMPPLAVLSGPSFAREVAESHPTAVVIASSGSEIARKLQHEISSLQLRCYASSDVVGVELAGALKNVIAIAAGISDGLDFGTNAKAALITRGLAEMTRLGTQLGARAETFAGLAGIGDLVLTCTGELSRNRHVGLQLGRGRTLKDIVSGMKMVAEGISTTLSVERLGEQERVELPICRQIYEVLYQDKNPREALQHLMSRRLKDEFS